VLKLQSTAPVLLFQWRLHLTDEEVQVNAQHVIQSINTSQPVIDLVPTDVHLLPAKMQSALLKVHSGVN